MNQAAFEIQRHVEFYETDGAGIVHFSNFFRYMETCEHAFIRSLGPDFADLLNGSDSGWPRVNVTCDYRAPACFGDLLTTRLYVAEVRTRSVRYRFEIAHGEVLVAEGTIAVAHVKKTEDGLKAMPLPGGLREKLLSCV